MPSCHLPRHIALYRQDDPPVDRLLNGTLALDDIDAGFDRLHARWRCGKQW